MSKFNAATARPAAFGPVTSEQVPSQLTFQGGAGYARDAKSELFLLAVMNLVGEETFYVSAGDRDSRFVGLVHAVTQQDPDWTGRFLRWLRTEANLRSAALVGAAEFARARLLAGEAGLSRQVVDSVLLRADEPGELLAYWTSRYGRSIPKPVKRGIADGVRRLYDQRSLLKWDSAAHGYRFADVLELTHASPAADSPWQGDLFRHAIDRRHKRDNPIPDSLPLLVAHADLMSWPHEARIELFTRHEPEEVAAVLRDAGMTWESLSGWLQAPLSAKKWAAIIPSMGYMALLRNLRNFDQAGLSDRSAGKVAERLADPDQVARSRQLPMRFLSAYNAAPSLRWAWPLEQALQHSLGRIPALRGRTLVLVDTSGSMDESFSRDGSLMRWDAAVLFGLALAQRCEKADVVSFSNGWQGQTPSLVFFPPRRGNRCSRPCSGGSPTAIFSTAAPTLSAPCRGTSRGMTGLSSSPTSKRPAAMSGRRCCRTLFRCIPGIWPATNRATPRTEPTDTPSVG
ncbi:TROVE domain-containing protein [Fodinicola feengrottensis]|uniref:TROVE domain-containing protein n=1 Tax=Fodinicola feengrottensis TaxID=435914 RepID=UPI0024433A0A|nr:TROVE domain-containing protein [Fodinicola feengrottensis]